VLLLLLHSAAIQLLIKDKYGGCDFSTFFNVSLWIILTSLFAFEILLGSDCLGAAAHGLCNQARAMTWIHFACHDYLINRVIISPLKKK
jgi:hypothetical protein